MKPDSVTLLEEALFLLQNGERAPGGDETWSKWAVKTEAFLRGFTEAVTDAIPELIAEVRRLEALVAAHERVGLRFAQEVADLERQLEGRPEPVRRQRSIPTEADPYAGLGLPCGNCGQSGSRSDDD